MTNLAASMIYSPSIFSNGSEKSNALSLRDSMNGGPKITAISKLKIQYQKKLKKCKSVPKMFSKTLGKHHKRIYIRRKQSNLSNVKVRNDSVLQRSFTKANTEDVFKLPKRKKKNEDQMIKVMKQVNVSIHNVLSNGLVKRSGRKIIILKKEVEIIEKGKAALTKDEVNLESGLQQMNQFKRENEIIKVKSEELSKIQSCVKVDVKEFLGKVILRRNKLKKARNRRRE